MKVADSSQRRMLTLVGSLLLVTFILVMWSSPVVFGAHAALLVHQQDAPARDPLVFTPMLTGVSNIMQTRGPALALTEYLSATSGIPMQPFVPTDYGATMQGLRRGVYDVVYLPAPFYVKAQAELGVVGAVAVSVSGAPTTTGLIVVAADSEIATLDDLVGKAVGAADLENAAGWVMPAAALKAGGINPLADLDVYFTGTDPENVLAVLNGELDAAFISAIALSDPAVLEAVPDAAEQVTILAEFPDVPVGVLAFRADLDPADQAVLLDALTDPALAEATNAEGNSLLAGLGWDGLVPVETLDFSALTDAAVTLGMIKEAPMPAPATSAGTVAETETMTGTEMMTETATVAMPMREPLVFTPMLTGVSNIMQTRGPALALTDYLSATSGVPMKPFVPTDYGATLQGLRRGVYDVVYLPAPFYVKAQAELGAVGAVAVSVSGAPTTTGLIVVAADSEIATLDDLVGKAVGAADLENAAGWMMPAAALKAAGINPLADLDVYFTGTDPENVLAVLNGELDAAFISAIALDDPAVLEAAPDVAEQVTILAEFPDIPIGVLAFRADLDPADQAALLAALTDPTLAEATDAEGNSLLAGLGWDGLVPVETLDFSALTDAALTLGMIKAAD